MLGRRAGVGRVTTVVATVVVATVGGATVGRVTVEMVAGERLTAGRMTTPPILRAGSSSKYNAQYSDPADIFPR